MKPIDQEYFDNYCQRDQPYNQCWEEHTAVNTLFRDWPYLGGQVTDMIVLGTADSSILRKLEQLVPSVRGCEIYKPIIPKHDLDSCKVANEDMRKFVWDSVKHFARTDLIFTNALVYLEEDEMTDFLYRCRQLSKFMHHASSVQELAAPDPYRTTLKPERWWYERFWEAGWILTDFPYMWVNPDRLRSKNG